jgi:hypothetical protein
MYDLIFLLDKKIKNLYYFLNIISLFEISSIEVFHYKVDYLKNKSKFRYLKHLQFHRWGSGGEYEGRVSFLDY